MKWDSKPKAVRGFAAAMRDGDEILAALHEQLKEMQVKMPERPLNRQGEPLDPQLPFDLTKLNDERLSKLFGEFCRMAQYAKLHLAMFAVKKAITKRQDKIARAEAQLLTQGGSVKDKAARIELDKNVHRASMNALKADGVEALTEAMFEGYLIGRDCLSREQTRRQHLFGAGTAGSRG